MAWRGSGCEDFLLPGGAFLVPRGWDLPNRDAATWEHFGLHRRRQQRWATPKSRLACSSEALTWGWWMFQNNITLSERNKHVGTVDRVPESASINSSRLKKNSFWQCDHLQICALAAWMQVSLEISVYKGKLLLQVKPRRRFVRRERADSLDSVEE